MSTASVLSPTEFESRLERYLFERSEEWRAVRVGEKEVSEQAEIVRRFADLFSREQLDALVRPSMGPRGTSASVSIACARPANRASSLLSWPSGRTSSRTACSP